MTTVQRELEIKYAADDALEVPPLAALVEAAADGPGEALADGEERVHHLAATYWDTPDHRLAAGRLTLRRRTGGGDAGWHLKAPAGGGARSEVHEPLGADDEPVPAVLRRMVWARTRGEELVPVLALTTERRVRHLLDASGRVLVELADDRVTAQRLQPAPAPGSATRTAAGAAAPEAAEADGPAADPAPLPAVTSWREVEVELVDGDPAHLEAVDAALRGLGMEVSASASKLARGLGATPAPAPTAKERRRAARSASAADVVRDHLAEQVEQLLAQDVQVRLDAPDAVHKMRVATRRLRSALTTFAPVLGVEPAHALRAELRWWASELGRARDAEVLRERIAAAVADEDELAAVAAVAPRVDRALAATHDAARSLVLVELDSVRYETLLLDLARVRSLPATDLGERPAAEVLPRLVRRTHRRLRHLVAAALVLPDGGDREELLHEARKQAKRARYAGESVVVLAGKDASAFAAAVEGVQEVLGEHQDSVVARERLLALALAERSPRAAFLLGRLHAREQARGEAALRGFDAAWKVARKRSVVAWTR